jgi:hypothetical protein
MKNASIDWTWISKELPGLSQVMEDVAQLADGPDMRSSRLCTLRTLIPHYHTQLNTLQKPLDINKVRKPLVQAPLWPLRKANIEQTMAYLFHSHYRMMLALEWHNSAQASSQYTAEFGKMKGGNANGLWGVAKLSGAKLGMSHVASAF